MKSRWANIQRDWPWGEAADEADLFAYEITEVTAVTAQ